MSGRRVREWSQDGLSGENRLQWDGLDQRGDAVANGVYLLRVSARPAAGGKAPEDIEPFLPWNLSNERRAALGDRTEAPTAPDTS